MQFKNRFNQKYKDYPESFGSSPMPVLKQALRYVSEGSALDLGVGNGRNALYLLSNGFKVTGVDMSEEGISLLRQRINDDSNIELFVKDVLDFKSDKKFDLVCAIGLLHFFKLKDAEKLVRNMKEFTKSGGINVVGAKMTQNFMGDLPHIFGHSELKKMYMDSNWDIKHYEEFSRPRGKVATLIAQKPN